MRMLLIDGNSILNRAFYGIRPLSAKDGTPTNGAYGFMNILFRLLDEVSPDSACVAFDLKAPTFRHKLYSEYKATRHPTPEDLLVQFPVVKELLDAFGIPRAELAGYEADDIIGTLSAACPGECFIATGDRDSFQLIGDKVTVLLASTKAGAPETLYYNSEKIMEIYGITPLQLREVKGLMGDTSDNIPGVKGVGEKTACELIRKYGTVDGVYENLDKERDSLRLKLENGRDSAFLSRTLGEICFDVPIERDAQAYRIRKFDPATLAATFAKYDFTKFIDKFGLADSLPTEPEPVSASPVSSREVCAAQFRDTLASLERGDVCFDFDASAAALNANGEVLLCTDLEGALSAVSSFKGRLRTNDYKKLCHELTARSLPLPEAEMCVSLGGYLLRPDRSDYSVFTTARHLSMPRPTDESAASAAAILPALCDAVAQELEADGMSDLLSKIELPLARTLTEMEFAGFSVDTRGLSEFGKELSERLEQLQAEIYRLAGCEFNINSPKQLGNVLFVRLGIKNGKKTKTGYSTDAETLNKLRADHEIVDLILEYRSVSKLISTYVVGLSEAADSSGRIHTTFLQTETRTGRISSREPNLQNIPVRTELGSRMRRFFRAEEGCMLIDADYSQIELRILAALSEDENMIDSFLSGNDFHRETAAKVFSLPSDEVTAEIRGRAKAINFGIVYGMGAYTLSRDLKISVYDAKSYIENYFRTYPKVKQWLDGCIEKARETGYARTLLGRRRRLEGINGKNANIRNFEERVAMNMPVQGAAADIIKLAMVNVAKRLKEGGFKTRLILQVHDELIAEAPLDEVEAVTELIRSEMENALTFAVPLSVEIGVGKTWYEAK